MTEYTFNGQPLTKITNDYELFEFNKQYSDEINAGRHPSALPFDVKYMIHNTPWVYNYASNPRDKQEQKRGADIIRATYKQATEEEKSQLIHTLLRYTRDNKTDLANLYLGDLAAELYRSDNDDTNFDYLTRCYMKLNANEHRDFAHVSLNDKELRGEAGNFERKYVKTLFKNISFAEKTTFINGVTANKYGYINEDILSAYIHEADGINNGSASVAYLLPRLKGKIIDDRGRNANLSCGDTITKMASDMNSADEREQLLYNALSLGAVINANMGSKIAQDYQNATQHILADKELDAHKKGGTIRNFEALIKYHQNEFEFSHENLSKIDIKLRTEVYQKSDLTPQNRTELAHSLIDEYFITPQMLEHIIDDEMKITTPNKRNLLLSEKIKTKVDKTKQQVDDYTQKINMANEKQKQISMVQKEYKLAKLTYQQQNNLLGVAAKIFYTDNKNNPKFPIETLETIITNAYNGYQPAQIPEHKIGFFTLGKEKKQIQNNAIREFNSVLAEVVKTPSNLKNYTGKILKQATTIKIANQYSLVSEKYQKETNSYRNIQNDADWIKDTLPDLQRIVKKFDALYSSQENARNQQARAEHLEDVRGKARESLKNKGMSVEEKFGGIEADKKAQKIIRKKNIEKIHQENVEGKNYASMLKNADNAIDEMAQNDADRLIKIIDNQKDINKERALENIVQKDKHVSKQGSVDYTKKVKEKMQKGK